MRPGTLEFTGLLVSDKLEIYGYLCAINATSIEATLQTAKAGAVAADFNVTVADQAVAVTNVAANADNTKYTLTVDLSNKEGTLKVNGTAASANVDYKVPTILSVQNVNGNQIEVTFSEPVNNATAVTNYVLYNTVTGKQTRLSDDNNAGDALDTYGPPEANLDNPANAAISADGKVVTLTLSSQQCDYLGIANMNTLDAVAYRLFVRTGNTITDKAATANSVAGNSYVNFTGNIGSDTLKPLVE